MVNEESVCNGALSVERFGWQPGITARHAGAHLSKVEESKRWKCVKW